MKLLKIQRTDAKVVFSHETKGPTIKANDPKNPGKVIEHVSNEARVVTAHETPLKSFDTALQNLGDVVANVLEVGQDWKKGLRVSSLALSYTKSGIRSASITFTKKLSVTGDDYTYTTPAFQIDDGATPDEGRRQCSKEHATAVAKMIKEAEKYAEGERQQTMLKFGTDEDGPTEPTDGDVLDLGPGSQAPAPEEPKAKKPRGAVAAGKK